MFGRVFVATLLFGIEPHIVGKPVHFPFRWCHIYGRRCKADYVIYKILRSQHSPQRSGDYQKETTFGIWMKEPASSPGLLDCAVCARVVNTNLLTVTNAGCRMRFYPTAVYLWFFHMLRMWNTEHVRLTICFRDDLAKFS